MKKCLFVLAMIAVLSLVLGGCDITISGNSPLVVTTPSSGSSGTAHLGKQTKASGCVAHGGLPDSACTPGAIFAMQRYSRFARTGTQVQYVTYRSAKKIRPTLSTGYTITIQANMKSIILYP